MVSQKIPALIVMGSGGHTTEMIRLLGGVDVNRFSPRSYFIAQTDSMSEKKTTDFEKTHPTSEHCIYKIPRGREVKQSYITSIFTTLWAFLICLKLVLRVKPQLVLCNGPGTCVPVVIACHLFKLVKILPPAKVVYVESICRVETLSLSGRILYKLADEFLVQWPQLSLKYPNAKYIGRLV